MSETSRVTNSPEFIELWNQWLKTPSGATYRAGWGDYTNETLAGAGRVWVLERIIERLEAENAALIEAWPGDGIPHPLGRREARGGA